MNELQLQERDARKLADRIKDALNRDQDLREYAYRIFLDGSWKGEGYSNWTDYVRSELSRSASWASRIAHECSTVTPPKKTNGQIAVEAIDAAIRVAFGDHYWMSQLRVGCGFGQDGERTMDMWGISPKRPYTHTAVEIKRSRSDFSVDKNSPLKQRRARLLANQFYYAAPVGLLTAKDLPPWSGLIEVQNNTANIAVPAPWYDSSPPTWSFVAHLIRQSKKGLLT